MRFRDYLLENLLMESKQSIVNLRYPEIIARLLYEEFGKNAVLIAKWYRDSRYSRAIPDNWWLNTAGDYRRVPSLYDLTQLYGAVDNPEKYNEIAAKIGLSHRIEPGEDVSEHKAALRKQIKAQFFDETFFTYPLIQDIKSGKVRDVAQYKSLPFWDAQHKYDARNVFQERTPLKTYKNGFKWIDVGKRCSMVGTMMKNCGSAGLMSMDEDRTMIVLFGPENVAHVMVTYSPNEKRISGDVGVGSSEVKSKYHEYILDLTKILGARFDTAKSSSYPLRMKYLLQDKATGLRQIQTRPGAGDTYFTFNMNGTVYYANPYVMVSREDTQRALAAVKQGLVKPESKQRGMMATLFNYRNQPIFQHFGVKYIPLRDL